MCGIVAGMGSKLTRDIIRVGLLETQIRGKDATGVFQPGVGIVKTNKKASDFVESDEFKKVVDNAPFFIGHCRAATNGLPTINDNNHPMMGDKWVIVHNGVVSMKKIDGYSYKGQCDTEVLLSYLETYEEIGKALEDIHGSAAIVLSKVEDIRNGKSIFYIWRHGAASTLSIAFNDKLKRLFIASTDNILKYIITEHALCGLVRKIGPDWAIDTIFQHELWKIDGTNNKFSAEKLGNFKPSDNPNTKEVVVRRGYYGNGVIYGKGYTDLATGEYRSFGGNRTTPTQGATTGTRTVTQGGKTITVFNTQSPDFDCPESGFDMTSPVCQTCSEEDDCLDSAQADIYLYLSKTSEEIVKSKKCDSKFDNNKGCCRTCAIRLLCSKNNKDKWDNIKGSPNKGGSLPAIVH